jgi:endoglucanase
VRRPARAAATALAAILLIAADEAPQPAIRLNQLGFQPGTAKQAIANDPSPTALPWSVSDGGGRVVAKGSTRVFGKDEASGDNVHQIDLGSLTMPGDYRLTVGANTGRTFTISPDIYGPLARAALNYFYQTRAGTPIEARFAGSAQWARPAGHPHEIVPCFQGADESGTLWPGCGAYKRNVTGGWYDAGDQGKYVVNGGIALWTLQNLWEVEQGLPAARLFTAGRELVPNQGKLDPLLVEAGWEMDFLLSMQVPDGTHMQLPVGRQPWNAKMTLSDVDASGMAHHKVADAHWTGLPMPPQKDPEPRLLYPPSTGATLNLAASAAQCARIWKTIDPAYSAKCLDAAKRAFDAAVRNPAIFTGNFTGSGGYGDASLSDEFYWAAAELFATTHNAFYGSVLRKLHFFGDPVQPPNWGGTAALGTITLALTDGALSAEEQAAQRKLIVAAADSFLAEESRSGYRVPDAGTHYSWGSNSNLLNRALLLGLAARFTGQAKYRDGMVDVMDYLLGRNPLDQSFISGFGARPMKNPHHRFWAHALDPHLPGPPPGLVSGGPNNGRPADDIARQMPPCTAAMRCWKDHIFAYSLNEVAINWNAPLVWVAAYLDDTR